MKPLARAGPPRRRAARQAQDQLARPATSDEDRPAFLADLKHPCPETRRPGRPPDRESLRAVRTGHRGRRSKRTCERSSRDARARMPHQRPHPPVALLRPARDPHSLTTWRIARWPRISPANGPRNEDEALVRAAASTAGVHLPPAPDRGRAQPAQLLVRMPRGRPCRQDRGTSATAPRAGEPRSALRASEQSFASPLSPPVSCALLFRERTCMRPGLPAGLMCGLALIASHSPALRGR